MKRTRGLLDEAPILLLPSLARAVGVSEALVLQQVHYWLLENERAKRNYIKGRYWTYNTREQWQEQFPFWSVNGVVKVLGRLRSLGVVYAERLNPDKRIRTLYYSINYDRLEELLDAIEVESTTLNKLGKGDVETPQSSGCIGDKVVDVYKEAETTSERAVKKSSGLESAADSFQPQEVEDHEMLRPERVASIAPEFQTLSLAEYVEGLDEDGVLHLARNPYRNHLVAATPLTGRPVSWRTEAAVTGTCNSRPLSPCKADPLTPRVQRPGRPHRLRVGGGYMNVSKSPAQRMRGRKQELEAHTS